MARIRTIKPEFWTDSFMVQLEPIYRLIYIALWTSSDDYGFFKDEVERIAMEIMPKENWEIVDDAIQLFVEAGRIELMICENGETFYKLTNWERHQKIDKPTISKIFRDNSRKVSIPFSTRRVVAEKYGCKPGEEIKCKCYYCGFEGKIHWFKLRDNRPSSWVTFPGLELDHLECEHEGGNNSHDNIILSCKYCNRHKGTKQWYEILVNTDLSKILENSRIISVEQGKERKGTGKGTGKVKIFVAPTVEEVIKYFQENGYSKASAEKMFKSYSIADWIDSKGNPVKNWKQKAVNVWFTNENQIKVTAPINKIQTDDLFSNR